VEILRDILYRKTKNLKTLILEDYHNNTELKRLPKLDLSGCVQAKLTRLEVAQCAGFIGEEERMSFLLKLILLYPNLTVSYI